MVRKGFVMVLGLVLAVGIYALLGWLDPTLVLLINSFTILVFFVAIFYGELDGAIMGTCAGLVQDALSHGVFGLAGLSLTVSGFLTGWLSQRLDVHTLYKRFVFLFIMSLFQLFFWAIFYFLIFRKSLLYSQPALYLQPLFSGLLASLIINIFKKFNPVV
ncbi:MAG: rod shape-determining protein MreD [Candidatus Saccharicenans sp.]|uniref:rod shape-determining protein MreD n=1 Tax=Candidatus Saccharicenans sp. TaxID=2819258 RepID=UPI00404A9E73